MEKPSSKELVEELNKHRLEISRLRSELDLIDKEKELWFRKKEELSSKIRSSIQKIKQIKAQRDALTTEVKSLKPKRDSANKELSSRSEVLSKLKKERSDIAKSLDIKSSPSRIKQQIEILEFKIETETISFEKEKDLMKKIKGLKKEYNSASVLSDSNKKIREVIGTSIEAKKEANQTHKTIQDKARQSQILHEEILKLSAEIDKTKVEEEGAFKKFMEFKKKFSEVNALLKEKLNESDDVKSELNKISYDRKEKRKQEVESFLKSKEEEVNEKIRKKQKLTNEDLLVFQKFGK